MELRLLRLIAEDTSEAPAIRFTKKKALVIPRICLCGLCGRLNRRLEPCNSLRRLNMVLQLEFDHVYRCIDKHAMICLSSSSSSIFRVIPNGQIYATNGSTGKIQ